MLRILVKVAQASETAEKTQAEACGTYRPTRVTALGGTGFSL